MALFRGSKKSCIGIDVGTSSIKIVELSSGDGGKIELTNYGEYSDSALHSFSAKLSSADIAQIIEQIMVEAKIIGREGAISVPIFSGFSTIISLPGMSDEELERAVIYEAKKYIPLPLSEVQFEWVRINKNPEEAEKSGTAEVLIVAVTNELIARYNEIAKLSNIMLKYLELDIFSIARSLTGEGDNLALVIYIGSQTTILFIIEKGWPVFTRTMNVSGAEFSKVLSSSLGIDLIMAEEMKRKEGVKAGEGIILSLLDSIFMEGKKVISEHAGRKGNGKMEVNKIIISGGSSSMPGLFEHARKILGEKVVTGSPFNGIMYPMALDSTLSDIAPRFDIAVGLALREFK